MKWLKERIKQFSKEVESTADVDERVMRQRQIQTVNKRQTETEIEKEKMNIEKEKVI